MKIFDNNFLLSLFASLCFFYAYFIGNTASPILIFALFWLGLSIGFLVKNIINKR